MDPIFTVTPRVNFAQLAAANTGADLSTNAALIFTGGTNGSLLVEARIKYIPGTNTVATAARLWINNNGTLSTTSNNSLITEMTVAAITSSQTVGTADYVFILPRAGLFVPANYRVYITVGTYSTGTFMCTGFGGDY